MADPKEPLNFQSADPSGEALNLGSESDNEGLRINGRKEDWLDRLLRDAGGVGVGSPLYPDFRNLKIGFNDQKFIDPNEDSDYEARRRLALGSLAGQGAMTGGLATGAPWLAALLGGGLAGATAKTPGDVAASTVAGSIPGTNFQNRGINALFGLGRGYLMAKGADTARAAVNGQPTPSWSPDTPSVISSILGGLGGLGTGTPKVDPKVKWTEEGKDLTNQVVSAVNQRDTAKTARDAAVATRAQAKQVTGKAYGAYKDAQAAVDSDKAVTQQKLQDALTTAQDKIQNSKVVGADYSNEVAKARADLAELQNKDWTQTPSGQRLAQAQQDYNTASQNSSKARFAHIMATKAHADAVTQVSQAKNAVDAWQNRKPDGIESSDFEKIMKALLKHGTGALAGGLFAGYENGWNPAKIAIGAGTGTGVQWLNNTPQGRQVLSGAPQLIPGLSNFAANQ